MKERLGGWIQKGELKAVNIGGRLFVELELAVRLTVRIYTFVHPPSLQEVRYTLP
jgi:hypothetical protein